MTQLFPVEELPATESRTSDFPSFWALYPRKVGKIAAQAAYRKALKLSGHDEIMKGLSAYLVTKPAYADWCHPATWLNQGRWMDEPDTVPALKAGIVNGAFRGESLEGIAQIVIKYGATWARCRYPRDVLELLVRERKITEEQKDAAL